MWLRRLWFVLTRVRAERELDAELAFHLEEKRRALMQEGLEPAEADARARRSLGGLLRNRERARDVWSLAWLDAVVRDLRYAARVLRRTPSFTLAATATLALAIGANTAIFSLVDGILLRPLPYAQPDRLVVVDGGGVAMHGAFAVLRRESRTLDYAAFEAREVNLTGRGLAQRVRVAAVSGELFSILGVQPHLGRAFRPGEDAPRTARAAIVSHWFWQQRLGAAPDVIGRQLVLDERAHEIVGVMPAGLVLPAADIAMWVPLELDPADVGTYWGRATLTILGRLRPASTIEAGRAELRTWIPRIRTMFPWRMPDIWGQGASIEPWRETLVGGVRLTLVVLLGTVALVWVVACVNVANLFLARTGARSHEMALRGALGASRTQIVRQLFTESLVVASMGGFVGWLLAIGALSVLTSWLPSDTPRLAEVSMNLRVLAFGAIVTMATALFFGLMPAWRSARANGSSALAGGDRRTTATSAERRMSAWLVAAQVALAVVLVVSAGLLLKSLWRLSSVDTGFAVDRLFTAEITPNASVCPDVTRCTTFYDEVLRRARRIQGVAEVAAVSSLPLSGGISAISSAIEDHPRDPSAPAFVLWQNAITPEYFRTMGIPLLRGRGFTEADRDRAPLVAIVSAKTARRFWPNADPIGRRIRPVSGRHWRTIVGVVGDVTDFALAGSPDWIDGTSYVPHTQSQGRGRPPWPMTLVLRAAGDDAAGARELPAVVAGISADAPVTRVQSMDRVIATSLAAPRTIAWLLASFAALALGLGAVGVGGVIAYTVSQRSREIGIRVALGGRPADVLKLTMGRTLALTTAGLVIGVVASLGVARILRTLLFDTAPRDPLTLVTTAVVVSVVTLIAALIPARRALRLDPAVVLRAE